MGQAHRLGPVGQPQAQLRRAAGGSRQPEDQVLSLGLHRGEAHIRGYLCVCQIQGVPLPQHLHPELRVIQGPIDGAGAGIQGQFRCGLGRGNGDGLLHRHLIAFHVNQKRTLGHDLIPRVVGLGIEEVPVLVHPEGIRTDQLHPLHFIPRGRRCQLSGAVQIEGIEFADLLHRHLGQSIGYFYLEGEVVAAAQAGYRQLQLVGAILLSTQSPDGQGAVLRLGGEGIRRGFLVALRGLVVVVEGDGLDGVVVALHQGGGGTGGEVGVEGEGGALQPWCAVPKDDMKLGFRPQDVCAADGDDALPCRLGGQSHQALGIHPGNSGIRGFIGQVRDPEPLLPVVLALGVDLEGAVLVDHKSDLAIDVCLSRFLQGIAPALGYLRLQLQIPNQSRDHLHRHFRAPLQGITLQQRFHRHGTGNLPGGEQAVFIHGSRPAAALDDGKLHLFRIKRAFTGEGQLCLHSRLQAGFRHIGREGQGLRPVQVLDLQGQLCLQAAAVQALGRDLRGAGLQQEHLARLVHGGNAFLAAAPGDLCLCALRLDSGG